MGPARLALVLAASAARAQDDPCACAAEPSTPLLTCRATGDPHFTDWHSEHYDFMGRGLYEFGRFSTECGCAVVVQTLQAQLTRGYPANAAIAAVAFSAGDTFFSVTGNGEVRWRAGRDGAESEPLDAAGAHPPRGGVSIAFEGTSKGDWLSAGKEGKRWRFGFGGGGHLLVQAWASSYMPAGYIYNVWLSVPSASVEDATGLCVGRCSGLPYLPFTQCDRSRLPQAREPYANPACPCEPCVWVPL